MIKELWTLIKMLFSNRPSDIYYHEDELDVRVMKHFPAKGFAYMMWCGMIITRNPNYHISERSRIHETIHVLQAFSEHGDNWLRFYLSYVWHWLRQNPFTHPSSSAYYTNRYEVEAYAQEDHPEYTYMYSRDNLRGKYSIRHAKKIYKALGGSREWKKYVKQL